MLIDVKKNLMTGLGAVLLTKDKIEEITRRLVDEARLSREDADLLVEELYATGQRQWSSIETSIKDAIRKTISSMDVGSRQELEKLKTKVSHLQTRVDLLETSRDETESQ
jgi:polyhydroxyalkanoate synthesis regulator phasin